MITVAVRSAGTETGYLLSVEKRNARRRDTWPPSTAVTVGDIARYEKHGVTMTHTPGPWFVNGGTKGKRMTFVSTRSGGCIADVYTPFEQGDAHLIAAAPVMLAAIDAMLLEIDSGNDFAAWEAAKQQMRDARAKAMEPTQ